MSQNSQENTCARDFFNFIKKETLAQVFSCEFYDVSKNTFSYRVPPGDCFFYLQTNLSKLIHYSFHRNHKNMVFWWFQGK